MCDCFETEPMTGTTIDWALWIGAGVLAAGALLLFAWALVADRSRGRKRCPKCWYPMDSIPAAEGLHCPECGTAIADEKSLRQTRRRWRSAGVAMVLGVLAYALSLTPRVIHGGWPSAIPSTVLVSVWPVSIKDWVAEHFDMQVGKDPIITELDERLKESKLAGWQASMWRGRVESYFRKQGRFGIAAEQKVLEKLARARVTQKIETQPLKDVLQMYEQELGVPIVAEWSVLDAEQIVPDMTVTFSHTSASGFDALDGLLRTLGADSLSPVQWRVEGNKVVIGVWNPSLTVLPVCSYELARLVVRDQEAWRQVREGCGMPVQYPGAQDLVPSTEFVEMADRLKQMQQAMTSLIDPENWIEGGGDTNVCVMIDSRAIVRTPARGHGRISSLLDAMDAAWKKGGTVAANPEDDWEEIAKLHAKLQNTLLNMPAGPVRVETLVQTLTAVSGVPFDVDWAGLASVRVLPELNVEVVGAELSVAQALDRYISRLVLDSLDGVSWTIHSGAVRIGARSAIDTRAVNRVYNLHDLLPPIELPSEPTNGGYGWLGDREPIVPVEEYCSELVRIITMTVDPEGWIDGGGESGSIRAIGPLLVVQNNARNHFAIDDLLAKLRRAKDRQAKKAGSTPAAESSDDWDKIAQVYSKLTKTILKMPGGSITLDALAESISAMGGVPVDFDWQGLSLEGINREQPIEMEAGELNAALTLDHCTSALVTDTASRIAWTINAGLVQIGSRESIRSRQVTRVYDTTALRKKLDDVDFEESAREFNERTIEELRHSITQNVDPEGWRDNGGDSGTIVSFDSFLIVTTTPNNHFAIEELIVKLRSGVVPNAPSSNGQ